MVIIFFQNCVSPHQMSYIKELPSLLEVDEVLFVSPRVTYSERSSMGWSMDDYKSQDDNLKFYISPSNDVVEGIYKDYEGKDTFCLYSGINDFPELTPWMLQGLKYDLKRGIITERPNVYWNKPLWLHKLRFLCRTQKYVKYFDYVFCIGGLAIDYYSCFSKRWKLIPWGYCTECTEKPTVKACSDESPLKMIFVGTVNKNKNVISVVNALSELKSTDVTFDIVGDGEERFNIEMFVASQGLESVVTFHGYKSMDEVYQMLPNYDLLLLPSKYDGWGAVVNEGLQRGLYVVCSDKCGAQSLLTDSRIGEVFHNADDLKRLIANSIEERSAIRANRERRIEWADCISGKTMARYMVDNLKTSTSIPALWNNKF